jgi:hypothetical protein
LESDITFHIGKLESELSLKVNRAAYDGDMYQLKSLIRAGADPKKTDYDGRSPLVRSLKLVTMMSCYQSIYSFSSILWVWRLIHQVTYKCCYKNACLITFLTFLIASWSMQRI